MILSEPRFAPLPTTVQGCRERLIELRSEITSIKTRIATADILRQTRRGVMDPQEFHRAKTALRFKQQETARVAAHLSALLGDTPREGFKDTLIDVLREVTPEAAWQSALALARSRHLQGAQHG